MVSIADADALDALVGMLLEQARISHGMMGGALRDFDFDTTRDRLYALAAAPPGASSRADRYRDLARRGRGRPHPGDEPGDGGGDVVDLDALPPCER